MVAGPETVSDGGILIDGRDVTFDEPAERGIAMVFQSYALYPHMNVYDNIAFNLRLARFDKGEIDKGEGSSADPEARRPAQSLAGSGSASRSAARSCAPACCSVRRRVTGGKAAEGFSPGEYE